MEALRQFLQPYNLIFELPILFALIYSLILAVTGIDSGSEQDGGGLDTDVDVDIDGDVDTDLHAGDHTGDHAHEVGEENHLTEFLSFLGIGKIPLSIVMVSLLGFFGFTGLAANSLFYSSGISPEIYVSLSFLGAAAVSIFLTGRLSSTIKKYLPSTETYGVSKEELAGREASVRYTITETNGTAQVYDKNGTLHEVECRVPQGNRPIQPGEIIILAEYDVTLKAYIVYTHQQYRQQFLNNHPI